jgi:hypothetical protein
MGSCSPRPRTASVPFEFGRSKNAPVLDVSRPFVIVTGKPVCRVMIDPTCQPPTIGFSTPFSML